VEGSSQRSRADGDIKGKVSFRDGTSGGMEKGEEAGVRDEDLRHQEGPVRSSLLPYHTPPLICTQVLISASLHQ
jgi:hypothetical protein